MILPPQILNELLCTVFWHVLLLLFAAAFALVAPITHKVMIKSR